MTGSIVILEGSDGVGKTTLAKELVERFDAYYIHNGLWKPGILIRHLAAARLAVRKAIAGRFVVIDRLYISEHVYGTAFRGSPAYDSWALHRTLEKMGAVTILCVRRDVAKHMAHFEELRASRPEKFDRMEVVAREYLRLADTTPPGSAVLKYDMDVDGRDMWSWIVSNLFDEVRKRRPR